MKLTLFLYPEGFSYSSWVHQQFAKQFGIEIDYTQTVVEASQLHEAILAFRRQGGVGANVTMPHKEAAFELCQEVTPIAKLGQSVNTLYWEGATLCGDSTDGRGLMRDIKQNLKHVLEGKRILILGSGGAVAAILPYFFDEKVASITIANRSLERPLALKRRFEAFFKMEIMLLSELLENPQRYHFDWLIQALPAQAINSLTHIHPSFIEGGIAYELTYPKDKPSEFKKWVMGAGALAFYDGLGMLVEQAAFSFKRWTTLALPSTQPVLKQLRSLLLQAMSQT